MAGGFSAWENRPLESEAAFLGASCTQNEYQ